MKKVIIGFCILCMVGMVTWRVTKNTRKEAASKDLLLRSSEAQSFKDNITILGDEWLGYMVFRSRVFQDLLAEENIGVTFKIEHNFQKRFQDLSAGKADLVLATADSYLVNGKDAQYPGVICAVIDESFGGDALIAANGIASIDDLNSDKVKGAYVGFSPSEFLLKSQVAHFKLDNLAPRVSSFRQDSADQAYDLLQQGKVDFAVLWEPYASRALKKVPGAERLIDTSQAQDLIIDVAISSRKLAADNPQLLKKVLTAYFKALGTLEADPERMLQQAKIDSGESKAVAQQMLSGIRFVNYRTNKSSWLDTGGQFRMKRALGSITQILEDVGDLKGTLPPRAETLIHTRSLMEIENTLNQQAQGSASASLGHYFRSLSPEEWGELSQNATGTLMNRPISFAQGSSEIDEETKSELLAASEKMIHYPYHRLIVQAHVSPGGGEEVEKALSQERADIIKNYLLANTDFKKERIYALGMGAQDPVMRKDGESSNAWKRRCRRASVLISVE